ncbi:MAG: 2-phospho-L-lactate guanylyltransferase [Candidatus Bathyarchaeia archaeon]
MSIFTLVPVKRLSESKKRLSMIFKPEERRDFVVAMLRDVLKAISLSGVERTVIIGSDSIVQRLSSDLGAFFLPDTGEELNQVIEYATDWCIRREAESLLILPADIPLVTSSEIDKIISLCSEKPSVAISPSSDGGTNALMRRPPGIMPTHFGAGSFKKHINEASRKGVKAKVYRSLRLSLDIDSPRDLKRFVEIGKGTETYRFLKRNEIEERLVNLSNSSVLLQRKS